MSELMPFVDVCIANEEDIEKVFGIKAENTDVNNGKLDYDSYNVVASELLNKFNLSKIACTLRTSISASDNKWTAILYDGNEYAHMAYYMGNGKYADSARGHNPTILANLTVSSYMQKQIKLAIRYTGK